MEPEPLNDWIQGLEIDGFTGATPLALQKFEHVTVDLTQLFFGLFPGSAGESSAALILVCGLYLIARRMMDWRIPAGVFLGAVLTAAPLWLADPEVFPSPLFVLFSGGLMLGALFMASDMVASPVTPLGALLYGVLIGFITVIIRVFGGLPEGVMYAILLGNAASPLIASVTQPRVYGTGRSGGSP